MQVLAVLTAVAASQAAAVAIAAGLLHLLVRATLPSAVRSASHDSLES